MSEKSYHFMPQADITTHELALVVALGFVRTSADVFNDMPDALKRHFAVNVAPDEDESYAEWWLRHVKAKLERGIGMVS